MYNEPRHIVTVFKDYLIYDDFSEYLKRFYLKLESHHRLPRVFEFYSSYSKLFPSFVALGQAERNYMFKNISRKQKLIDEKDRTKEKAQTSLVLFNSKFIAELN
jgi:hypothetical protein